MTNGLKNTLSLIIGSCFNFIFLWMIALVAALPVPAIMQSMFEYSGVYYIHILLLVCSLLISFIILLILRKAFSLFSNQNIIFLTLPIVLFISYVYWVLEVELEPLLWAAAPTLLIAFLLRNNDTKHITAPDN